jgi:hypothetical protein
MKLINVFICCLIAIVICSVSSDARGEENKQLSLDSLLGKYDGTIETRTSRPLPYSYQTEVVSVDKSANTVALVSYCRDCQTRDIKWNKCKITEVKDTIKFICKAKVTEEYTFDGESLKANGTGQKYDYTIYLKKIAK